jgi:hypothetical protein
VIAIGGESERADECRHGDPADYGRLERLLASVPVGDGAHSVFGGGTSQCGSGTTGQSVEPVVAGIGLLGAREFVAHCWLPSALVMTSRARAMSDRTVPSGTSRIEAISAIVRSPAKCSVTASRGREGNSRTTAQNTITSADGSAIDGSSRRERDQNRISVRRRRHRDLHALMSTQ